MLDESALIQEIRQLKREQKAVILAHNYQREEIQEIADFIGDSLDLSKKAKEVVESLIIFCGVRFMAETAKILAPEKTIVHPRSDAGCPMADMITPEDVMYLREQYPGVPIVCYVNTTADVKALCDVCCTSANAVKVVEQISSDKIIFVPDRNLAQFVQRHTSKKVIPWDGYCYVHERIRVNEVEEAKRLHPDALLLVHPECRPEVIDLADEVASTSGMVRLAKASAHEKLLIATEEGLIRRLRREIPHKKFLSASTAKVCYNMKKITLQDVYSALINKGPVVELEEFVAKGAGRALEQMFLGATGL